MWFPAHNLLPCATNGIVEVVSGLDISPDVPISRFDVVPFALWSLDLMYVPSGERNDLVQFGVYCLDEADG